MSRRLLGAVQFLTLVPIRGVTAAPAEAALFFPLVGAALGCAGGAVLKFSQAAIPGPLAALLVLMLWIAVTGALHEDGLADVADAFRAHRPPQRILEILKDSRIGTYGALAIVLSVLLRWQALASLRAEPIAALAGVQALSRAAMVVLARFSRPAGEGLGAAFCGGLSTAAAVGAAMQGIAAALLCGPRAAAWILVGNAVLITLAGMYFHRRIGGVTGDCLGAAEQLSQTCSTFILTCAGCIS